MNVVWYYFPYCCRRELITPPVGINVFGISSMAKDVPMMEPFKGVIPFFLSNAVRVAFIELLPSLTLSYLPYGL